MNKHSRKVRSKIKREVIQSSRGSATPSWEKEEKEIEFQEEIQIYESSKVPFFPLFFSGKRLVGIWKKFRKKRYTNRFFIHSRKLIDYKNIKLLYRFIGCQGKIIPRRVSRVAFAVQRLLSAAIQKVRILALLPFVENKKRSQKVRMLKQRIKEKKRKKDTKEGKKKKDSSNSSI